MIWKTPWKESSRLLARLKAEISMAKPAVFVDRDGTLNRDCPYCSDPEDLYVFADTVKIVKGYQDMGFYVFLISNQSGLNRGYFTHEQMEEFNNALFREMEKMGVHVDDAFICPHRPDENCSCRKPEPGLIEQALRKYHIDMTRSVYIGDRDDMDGELARKFHLKFILVRH